MKINIIILVSLITFVIRGTELSAQEEEALWEEEVWEEDVWEEVTLDEEIWEEDEEIWEEEVIPVEENELEFYEEITDSSVSQEPNTADGTQVSEIEPHQVTKSLSEGEISPKLVANETPTTITNPELDSNQLNNLSEEIPTLENPESNHDEILPKVTYDPPIVLNQSTAIKEELPPPVESPSTVPAITTEETVTPSEEFVQTAPQSIDSKCNNPAIYFNDIREANLPAVEIPLYMDINGQSISSIGLFTAKLRIPFGFADFELKEAVFKEILLNSSPCNAQFIPETGVLNVPQVEIPTFITVTNSTTQPQDGPVITCRAVLQQSNIRILALSLKELQCDSSPVSIQTDIN